MRKRITSILLSVVMLVITTANGFYLNTTGVTAAESRETIKMPVQVFDHLNDKLLFEYDLATTASDLNLENFMDITGQSEGKGLVESTLGPNGTPVYKQEIVEAVAEIVENYMEENHNLDSDIYNQLFSQIVVNGTDTDILSNDLYTFDLETLGWSFPGLTYEEVDGKDSWVNTNGDVIWYRNNDELHTNGPEDNKAYFDFGNLEAGTYTLETYRIDSVNIVVKGTGFETIINNDNKTFTVTEAGNVTMEVSAVSGGVGEIVAPKLKKDGATVIDNFAKPQNAPMSKIGWVYPDDSTWGTDTYGGISCENNETSVAYKVFNVVEGRTYEVEVGHNENDLCKIIITDMAGNKVANADEEFIAPAGATELKVVISCVANPDNEYRRVDNITVKMSPDANLGNYNDSKTKYDNGAKFDDITTCMDYAYYMLNSFWTDTYGDITQKTNLYKTITLAKENNDDVYEFSNSKEIIYDLENGDMAHGTESYNTGFYPLDKAVLGEKSDLVAPFGGTEIENPYDGMTHNYHYSMKVHCQFLYKENANLEFYFRGDDDVYLFIDGKLVLDIGGAHLNRSETIDINEVADKFGLKDGEVYDFDFFYMERHTTDSNITIQTNMIFETAEAKPAVVLTDSKGNVLENGAVLKSGDEVGVEYKVTAGHDEMSNITFNDENLDIVIGKDGIDLGSKGVYVKDNIVVNVYDVDGNVKDTITISKDDLDDASKVAEFCKKVGEIRIDKGETVGVTGIFKEVNYNETFNPCLSVEITAPQAKYTENGTFIVEDEMVAMLPVELVVIPTSTPDAAFDTSLVDEQGNKLTSAVNEGDYVGIDYTLTAKADGLKNINIDDKATGFAMSSEGITIPAGYNVDNGLSVVVTRADGTSETITVSKNDIDNKTNAYNELLSKIGGTWELGNGDTVKVTGLNTSMPKEGTVTSDAKATVSGPVPTYNDSTDTLEIKYVELTPADIESIGANDAYDVKFVIDETMGSLNGETTDRVNAGETTGTQPAVVEKEGYEFVGWTQTVGNTTTDVDGDPKDVAINANTTFTAVLEPKTYEYVVKYIDKDTGAEIATSKTATAKYNEDVTEEAIAIPNYGVSGDATKTITMKTSGNEIIFEYEIGKVNVTFETDGNGIVTGNLQQTIDSGKTAEAVDMEAKLGYSFSGWTMTNSQGTVEVTDPTAEVITEDTTFTANFTPNTYDYVVKYIDKATGEELIPSKSGQATYGEDITEEAIAVEGYSVNGDLAQTITMKTSGNEIIFEYEIVKFNVDFVADANGTVAGNANQVVNYKDTPEAVTPVANDGYEFLGWEITNSQGTALCEDPAAVEITEDTTFTAKFGPLNYGYVVRFVDEDGNALATEVRGPETEFGTEVTAEAIDIIGYTCDETSKTITVDVDNNEIVFVYKKSVYEVKFETDGNGTLAGNTTEKVFHSEKVSQVPAQSANDEYEFTGWTMTVNGVTTAVEDPATVEITANTVFTAHYTKKAQSGTIIPDNNKLEAPSEEPTEAPKEEATEPETKKPEKDNNKKNDKDDVIKPEESDDEVVLTSPKTGYENMFAAFFAMLMAAFTSLVIAIKRIKE